MTATVPAGTLLEWAVRESFVSYVERLTDGVIDVLDGAERTNAGFLFPGHRGPARDEYNFEGIVRFSGHLGTLGVELRELRIACSDGAGTIEAMIAGAHYPLAEFDGAVSGDDGTLTAADVVFTVDGAAILGGVYEPGAEAAPFRVRPV